MKRLILVWFFAALATISQAQTVGEWLRQKATQKKYLLQQIVALQAYIGSVQKSYSVAKDGLGLINSVKSKEFNLHQSYFHSLKTVSPAVRRYQKVADITALQKQIVLAHRKSNRQVQESSAFTIQEATYLQRVYDRLLNHSNQTMDELMTVTTDEILALTDDQRIIRIDALHAQMQDDYTFLKSFHQQVMSLAASRRKTETEVKISRNLHGLSIQQ